MNNYKLPNRQQGQISLLMLGMAFVFISCAVMALDTGRLYLERQRLQTQADMAALEVAAYMRFNASTNKLERDTIVITAARNNGFAGDSTDVTTQYGADDDYGEYLICEDEYSVGVELTRRVPDSLIANLAVLWPGSGFDGELTLLASACARLGGPQWVTFSGGTRLLNADLSESKLLRAILAEMLGTEASLSILSTSGLINLGLKLTDLADALDLNLTTLSPQQLLNTDVSVVSLLDASIESLSGELLSADLYPLELLLDELRINGAAKLRNGFRLGSVLVLDESLVDSGQLDATVAVGPLLEAAIFAANGSGVTISDTVEVPPLTAISLDLGIVSPPVIRVGPAGCRDGTSPPCLAGWRTELTTSQLDLTLNTTVNLLALAELDLSVDVGAGRAAIGIAELDSLGNGAYRVWAEGISSPVTVSTSLQLKLLPIEIPRLLLPSSWLDQIFEPPKLGDSADQGATYNGAHTAFVPIDWPPGGRDIRSTGVGGVGPALGGLLDNVSIELKPTISLTLVNVLFGILGPLLNLVLGTVASLVSGLEGAVASIAAPLASVLDPVLDGLGVSIGEMEVIIYDVSPGMPMLFDVPQPDL